MLLLRLLIRRTIVSMTCDLILFYVQIRRMWFGFPYVVRLLVGGSLLESAEKKKLATHTSNALILNHFWDTYRKSGGFIFYGIHR